MKKTTKLVLMSVLTIAMCVSLIAGATFALFTDNDSVNIVVSSGKVDVEASIGESSLYTNLYGVVTTPEDGEEAWPNADNVWPNGGQVGEVEGVFTLDRMTPGDGVQFNVNITNNSNVATLYRTKITCDVGLYLMAGFETTIDGDEYTGIIGYTSAWKPLAAEQPAVVTIEFYLPELSGDDYQDITCEIIVTVEAVQGNAAMSDEASVEYYDAEKVYTEDIDEISAALNNGKSVALTGDVDHYVAQGTPLADAKSLLTLSDGVTLDMRGHTMYIDNSDYTSIKGLGGIKFDYSYVGEGASAVIENGTIILEASSGTTNPAIYVCGATLTLKNVIVTTMQDLSSDAVPVVLNISNSGTSNGTPNTDGHVILENCTMNGKVNVGGSGSGNSLEATNTIFNGLLNVAGPYGRATLHNCVANNTNKDSNISGTFYID